MKQHEYREGIEAGQNFVRLAKAAFKASKPEKQPKPKKKATRRKKSGSDKG